MSTTVGPQMGDPPVPAAETTGVVPGTSRSGWCTRAQVQAVFLIALPVLVLAYDWLAAHGIISQVPVGKPEFVDVAALDGPEPSGVALYAHNCARCHGSRGTCDGATSPYLDPPARRFGQEKFMLASTPNGMATDEDLMYVITHGIPATAMPAFDHLPERDRKALVRHIRWMTRAGVYARLYQRAKKDEPDADPDVAELSTAAAAQAPPAPAIEVPADLPPPTSDSITRGQQTFAKNCATCHGPKGAGDGPQVKDMKNDNGRPTKPRDLARGIFKGGGEPGRLYVRIAVGMPGTPMPASSGALKPDEIVDLVNFVRSLSHPDDRPGGS